MSAAEKIDFAPRRFQIPDLNTHGAWVLPRLQQTYGLDERTALSWLRALVYDNTSLFLFQDTAVALAQIESANTLEAKPVVRERFVWVRDKQDKDQVTLASFFYPEIALWGRRQGAEIMLVEESSDVPHDMIKQHVGRIFTRQQQFARL